MWMLRGQTNMRVCPWIIQLYIYIYTSIRLECQQIIRYSLKYQCSIRYSLRKNAIIRYPVNPHLGLHQ